MSNMGWALDFIGGNCLCRLAAGCRLLSEEMMQVLTLRQPAPGLTPNWAPLLRFFLFTNIETSKAVLCCAWFSPRPGSRELVAESVAALAAALARVLLPCDCSRQGRLPADGPEKIGPTSTVLRTQQLLGLDCWYTASAVQCYM